MISSRFGDASSPTANASCGDLKYTRVGPTNGLRDTENDEQIPADNHGRGTRAGDSMINEDDNGSAAVGDDIPNDRGSRSNSLLLISLVDLFHTRYSTRHHLQ